MTLSKEIQDCPNQGHRLNALCETAAGGSVEAHLPRSRRQLSLDFPLSRHHSLDNPLQVICACWVSLDLSVQEIWQGWRGWCRGWSNLGLAVSGSACISWQGMDSTFYSSMQLINSFPQSQQAVIYPQLTKNVEVLSKRPLLANILMGCSYNPGIILMEYSYNPGASLFLQPNIPACKCPRL